MRFSVPVIQTENAWAPGREIASTSSDTNALPHTFEPELPLSQSIALPSPTVTSYLLTHLFAHRPSARTGVDATWMSPSIKISQAFKFTISNSQYTGSKHGCFRVWLLLTARNFTGLRSSATGKMVPIQHPSQRILGLLVFSFSPRC
jgi:hypothetical protein